MDHAGGVATRVAEQESRRPAQSTAGRGPEIDRLARLTEARRSSTGGEETNELKCRVPLNRGSDNSCSRRVVDAAGPRDLHARIGLDGSGSHLVSRRWVPIDDHDAGSTAADRADAAGRSGRRTERRGDGQGRAGNGICATIRDCEGQRGARSVIQGNDAEVRRGRGNGELARSRSRQGDLLSQGPITRVYDNQGRLLRAETAVPVGGVRVSSGDEPDLDGAAREVAAANAHRVGDAAGSHIRPGCDLELVGVCTVQIEFEGTGLVRSSAGGYGNRLPVGLLA